MAEVPAPKPVASLPKKTTASTIAAATRQSTRGSAKGSEVPWYGLALLLGAISGFAEVAVGDLMLTGFLALFFCMVMGALRPGRPWRWVLIVCGCIPLSRLFAAGVLHMYTERAQFYEAFLSFITGNAGAYVGSLGRKRANDLFEMIRTGKG
jgi:hypothetical protein